MTIPSSQIAVVTGDPRSGTSLMMQTLLALGVPVAGEAFPQGAAERLRAIREGRDSSPIDPSDGIADSDRLTRAKELNPLGFYEVPGVVMRGLRDIGDHGGKALKIIAPGLTRTPPDLIWRGILCLRDPRHVAQSQTRLDSNVKAAGARGWDNPDRAVNPTRYMLEMGGFLKWWREQTADFRARFIVVEYDDFLAKPAATVARIARHLDVTPTPEAIANVDTSLRRSPDAFTAWPTKVADDGAKAEAVYAALQTGDDADAVLALADVEAAADYHRREATPIYHADLCCNVRAGFLRQFDASPKLRAALLRSKPTRVQRGMTYESSPDYGGLSDKTYTRRMPLDLGGDVEVRMVLYQGVAMTAEQAQATHEQRRREGVTHAV